MVIVSGCGCGVFGGAIGDLAVGRRAAAWRVRDDAVPGGQLCDRHAPERRRGQQQPLARLGAGQLQIIAAVFDRRRGVRPHASIEAVGNAAHARSVAIPERGLAAALRIGGALARDLERPLGRLLTCIAVRGRVLRPHLRPVALQLLADHHGVGRPDALTELGLRDADRHGVVRCDHDPGIDFRCRRVLRTSTALDAVCASRSSAAPRSRARTLPGLRRPWRETRDD